MKVTTITLPLLCLTGCQSLVIDQIVIKSPNWLPGVDIYLDVEEDLMADAERLTNSNEDFQRNRLCHRCCRELLLEPGTLTNPPRHRALRGPGIIHPRTD